MGLCSQHLPWSADKDAETRNSHHSRSQKAWFLPKCWWLWLLCSLMPNAQVRLNVTKVLSQNAGALFFNKLPATIERDFRLALKTHPKVLLFSGVSNWLLMASTVAGVNTKLRMFDFRMYTSFLFTKFILFLKIFCLYDDWDMSLCNIFNSKTLLSLSLSALYLLN